jgi:membrane-bound lytic murein transglycosylase MltF
VVDELPQATFGDLPEIRQRGVLRVLVTYSLSGFCVANGQPLGLERELMRRFEEQLDRDPGPGLADRVRPHHLRPSSSVPALFKLAAYNAGPARVAALQVVGEETVR